MICPECYEDSRHADGCRLDPSKPRVISRRSFLRTLGVLGTAILVAPSLLELARPSTLHNPVTGQFCTRAELDAVMKEFYTPFDPLITPLQKRLIRNDLFFRGRQWRFAVKTA